MGWQTVVAVQLQAGNTIINPNGEFIYSPSPGAGNLKDSVTPGSGTDQFGNAYQSGVTSYGAAGSFAQLLGNSLLLNFGSGGSAVLFASAGGRLAIFSGNISGDIQSEIELRSASASGITGGEVVVSAGAILLNNSASTTTPAAAVSGFPISGAATLAQVITAVNNLYTMLGNIGIHS